MYIIVLQYVDMIIQYICKQLFFRKQPLWNTTNLAFLSPCPTSLSSQKETRLKRPKMPSSLFRPIHQLYNLLSLLQPNNSVRFYTLLILH